MGANLSRLFQGALSPLTVANFRRLLSSNFLWWGLRFMEMIVVGWLVLEMSNSAWQLALIGFFRSVPALAGGFISGPIVDRFGRRRVILMAQTTNMLVNGSIAALVWFDRIAVWHLAVAAVLLGIVWSLDWIARRSLLPDLVGKDKTVDALQLDGLGQNIARISGPLLAGLLIEAFGAFGAFAVMAAIAATDLLILLGLSIQAVTKPSSQHQASPLNDIIAGLRYVRQNRIILATLPDLYGHGPVRLSLPVMLPVFARDILSQGPVGLGILGSISGAGAFVGILLNNYIRRFLSNGWIFILGAGGQTLGILAFAFSSTYSLSLVLLFMSGIGQACYNIMHSSIILLAASDDMRSRAMGATVLASGVGPLGQLQIGALSDILSVSWAVRLSAFLGLTAIAVIAKALPDLHWARNVDTEPQALTK